jgi:glycerol uptake facilitator-like aquaporin
VFVLETAGTYLLVATVLATAVAKPGFGDLAPFAIGLSIFVAVGGCGALTGGFFNPARFLGPALVFGCNLSNFWLYLIAQFLGGVLAGLTYRFAFATDIIVQVSDSDGIQLSKRGDRSDSAR